MRMFDTDAVIAVDVQNDFCFGGALPVPLAEHVASPLNRAMHKVDTIVLTRDWHPSDHCSFEEQGGPWPMHCVQYSPGAEFQGSLHAPLDAILVSKGTDPDVEAYSGFCGTDLAERLHRRGVKRVFVGGLALDYCVKATALDAIAAGFEAWLLLDATRPVVESATNAVIAELRDAGVHMTSSGELE